MEASTLCSRIDEDFDLAHCRDEWWKWMPPSDHYTEGFRRRSMGLMLDNACEIRQVFTAVFPSARVLDGLLASDARDCLLVLHHAMHWDIRHEPAFSAISLAHLDALRDRGISLYVMHVPLDRSGPYSTTNRLAAALRIDKTADFYEYFGWRVGVLGTTGCRTVASLAEVAAAAVGHRVQVWPYGQDGIADGKVALIAGGGNDADVYPELAAGGINTFLTGVTARNKWSEAAHQAAQKVGINLIGLTHYSSEKFACMALCGYFADLGMPCSFLPDDPVLEDMG